MPLRNSVPPHLRKYVVEQDYSRYTPQDQAVWRYVLRQLRHFLTEHAHPCYQDGLAKTGIDVDRIPRIEEISEKISKFGWQALPVSGFIPPAAFMELQALSFLPIASDMRTIDHLKYTPAPDIVHEAAGHAPILVEPEFAAYLKKYASVARKAIISKQDMQQYEAIRILSDIKEDPDSTPEQIRLAELHLGQVTKSINTISEAALLGRMNWWTAEYGLIGDIRRPKIFGAGLLSSVGESRDCLKSHVRKIPLSIECLQFSYDITEPQPQLFVAKDFATLGDVLDQLSNQMAFRLGGLAGLKAACLAETVNTIQLDSGLQVSGLLHNVVFEDGQDVQTEKAWPKSSSQTAAYLQFLGPTQLSFENQELLGHGIRTHADGFGMPVGHLLPASKLSLTSLPIGKHAYLKYENGVEVSGIVSGQTRAVNGSLLLVSFTNCTVKRSSKVLFDPDWGTFDLAIGSQIVSVFGGPADRERFGTTDDFAAKIIPRKSFDAETIQLHSLYAQVRKLRESTQSNSAIGAAAGNMLNDEIQLILRKLNQDFPLNWLLRIELLEIAEILKQKNAPITWDHQLRERLIAQRHELGLEFQQQIDDGLMLVKVGAQTPVGHKETESFLKS